MLRIGREPPFIARNAGETQRNNMQQAMPDKFIMFATTASYLRNLRNLRIEIGHFEL